MGGGGLFFSLSVENTSGIPSVEIHFDIPTTSPGLIVVEELTFEKDLQGSFKVIAMITSLSLSYTLICFLQQKGRAGTPARLAEMIYNPWHTHSRSQVSPNHCSCVIGIKEKSK